MAPILLFVFLQIIYYSAAAEWTYLNQELWPQSCQGVLQSPIALSVTNSVTKTFQPFNLTVDASGSDNVEVINNGHSVQIRIINNTNPPLLSGGGLKGKYVLDSIHFHWEAEHAINGLRYPLEGHFVYFAKKYKTFQNASQYKNGIAVLGVLYDDLLVTDSQYFSFTSIVPKIANIIDQPVPTKVL